MRRTTMTMKGKRMKKKRRRRRRRRRMGKRKKFPKKTGTLSLVILVMGGGLRSAC